MINQAVAVAVARKKTNKVKEMTNYIPFIIFIDVFGLLLLQLTVFLALPPLSEVSSILTVDALFIYILCNMCVYASVFFYIYIYLQNPGCNYDAILHKLITFGTLSC